MVLKEKSQGRPWQAAAVVMLVMMYAPGCTPPALDGYQVQAVPERFLFDANASQGRTIFELLRMAAHESLEATWRLHVLFVHKAFNLADELERVHAHIVPLTDEEGSRVRSLDDHRSKYAKSHFRSSVQSHATTPPDNPRGWISRGASA